MDNGQREFTLRGGRITLHTIPTDKNGIWQCRLRLGADRKLVRRSTRTADIDEAKRNAEEIYDELRYKYLNKQALTAITFKSVAADFLKKVERDNIEKRLSKGRRDLLVGTINRYLLPFFGNFIISDINTAHFIDYDEWRLDYWIGGYGNNRQAYHIAKIPSQVTLAIEQGILRQVFTHAVAQGQIEYIPFMQVKKAKTNRRSAFDLHDYRHLMRTMRRRINNTQHTRIKHDRRVLELYLKIMFSTGMRIGEARSLTWGDVEIITTGSNGQTNEVLRLWVNGKTGKRTLIGTRAAKIAVRKLLKFYGFETLAEAREHGGSLFLKTNGEMVKTFEVGFKALLTEADIVKDRHGANRTLYCLRHTYATYRLLYGNVDVYLLSKNMGTSVAMIEGHYGHVTTTLVADKLL